MSIYNVFRKFQEFWVYITFYILIDPCSEPLPCPVPSPGTVGTLGRSESPGRQGIPRVFQGKWCRSTVSVSGQRNHARTQLLGSDLCIKLCLAQQTT